MITLMTELVLTRVFDVLLTTNLSYMVITCAMFAFGLSGVYAAIRPLASEKNLRNHLAALALLVAFFTVIFLPVMNQLPFGNRGLEGALSVPFLVMYAALAAPFFFEGLIFTTLFSAYPNRIHTLYFWDLAGAALGATIIIPLIPLIGPGGLLVFASAIALFASALFTTHRSWATAATAVGVLFLGAPFLLTQEHLEFKYELKSKHTWIKHKQQSGALEFSRWDPISKIEVIDEGDRKRIAYDGLSQMSWIFPFQGDYEELRANISSRVEGHFWQGGVLAVHYLKRDTNQRVLIIGGGGGQEAKAALVYGASHVDVVELVGTVVDLVKNKYASYAGDIYNDPRVRARSGEGRSVLRSTDAQYDVIQMYSNQQSASIAAGNGALAPTYLQTAEAYREYFGHLTQDGVLQINYMFYPRMITTAALAWKEMGRTAFQKHVVVFERATGSEPQPTLLIKMKPWTHTEVDEVKDLFNLCTDYDYRQIEFPLHPDKSYLPSVFYDGDPNRLADLASTMEYRVMPATDDRPYFNLCRKRLGRLEPDAETYLHDSVTTVLNSQVKGSIISTDIIHLVVTGVASVLFMLLFFLIPMLFSDVGKAQWPQKHSTLVYFSCLGVGFIIFELVFIQVFMQFIGSPLYTYSSVIFVMLLAAGVGSLCSGKMGISVRKRWEWPFAGIFVSGLLLLLVHPSVFHVFLGSTLPVRVLVTVLLIFPLSFFLGMPFPLGLGLIESRPKGAIAWAWGINGCFTVIGGLSSVVLSLYIGFQMTLLIALAVYVLAFWMYSRMCGTGIFRLLRLYAAAEGGNT